MNSQFEVFLRVDDRGRHAWVSVSVCRAVNVADIECSVTADSSWRGTDNVGLRSSVCGRSPGENVPRDRV